MQEIFGSPKLKALFAELHSLHLQIREGRVKNVTCAAAGQMVKVSYSHLLFTPSNFVCIECQLLQCPGTQFCMFHTHTCCDDISILTLTLLPTLQYVSQLKLAAACHVEHYTYVMRYFTSRAACKHIAGKHDVGCVYNA